MHLEGSAFVVKRVVAQILITKSLILIHEGTGCSHGFITDSSALILVISLLAIDRLCASPCPTRLQLTRNDIPCDDIRPCSLLKQLFVLTEILCILQPPSCFLLIWSE